MDAIRLTNMDNKELYVNLDKVISFKKHGRGTTLQFINGEILEVLESFARVQYLVEHGVLHVEL